MAAVRRVEVRNLRGLHARAASRFATLAGGFDTTVTVRRNGMEASGTSLLSLMTLAATRGTEIEIEAAGPEAEAALDALCKLVADRFGEEH